MTRQNALDQDCTRLRYPFLHSKFAVMLCSMQDEKQALKSCVDKILQSTQTAAALSQQDAAQAKDDDIAEFLKTHAEQRRQQSEVLCCPTAFAIFLLSTPVQFSLIISLKFPPGVQPITLLLPSRAFSFQSSGKSHAGLTLMADARLPPSDCSIEGGCLPVDTYRFWRYIWIMVCLYSWSPSSDHNQPIDLTTGYICLCRMQRCQEKDERKWSCLLPQICPQLKRIPGSLQLLVCWRTVMTRHQHNMQQRSLQEVRKHMLGQLVAS